MSNFDGHCSDHSIQKKNKIFVRYQNENENSKALNKRQEWIEGLKEVYSEITNQKSLNYFDAIKLKLCHQTLNEIYNEQI